MWMLLVIIVITIGVFVYIRIDSFISYRKYYNEFEHIFIAHKEIGFPELSEEQQYDILDNENWTHVSTLTKYEFVPSGLLNNYINISPNKYLDHLRSANLKNRIKFDAQNLHDGFFINETSQGYEYIFVERQCIVFRKKFFSYDKLLKYIVQYRLSTYTPAKYNFFGLK